MSEVSLYTPLKARVVKFFTEPHRITSRFIVGVQQSGPVLFQHRA